MMVVGGLAQVLQALANPMMETACLVGTSTIGTCSEAQAIVGHRQANKICQEPRLVTMEITMCRSVARIPSVPSTCMIGSLVVNATRVLLHCTAPTQGLFGDFSIPRPALVSSSSIPSVPSIGSSPDHTANHVSTIEPHSPGTAWAMLAFVWDSLDYCQRLERAKV